MTIKLFFIALITFSSTALMANVAQGKPQSCQKFYEKDLTPAYTLDKNSEPVLKLKTKEALALVAKIKSTKLENNNSDKLIADFKAKCTNQNFKMAKEEFLKVPACIEMPIDLDFFTALFAAKWNDAEKKQIKESVFQFVNTNLIQQNGRPVDYLAYGSVLSYMAQKEFITDEKQKASILDFVATTEAHLKNKGDINKLKTCQEFSKYLDEHTNDRINDQKKLKEIIAL